MEHELGPEIEIHGERPAWLADDEGVAIRWRHGAVWNRLDTPAKCVHGWEGSVVAIRLRADHPYYLATAKGFTYWPGGADAPDDWDGGDVLFSCWDEWVPISPDSWRENQLIIGYRKRMEPIDSHMNKVRYNAPFTSPSRPSDELVARIVNFLEECAENCDEEATAILAALNPDPMIQRARDICKDEFGVILPDDAPGMRAVLRGLREGGE